MIKAPVLLELSGPITLSNAITLTTVLTNPATFSGPISGGFSFNLIGVGVVAFGGSNTFVGDTIVNGPSLLVNSDGSRSAAATMPSRIQIDQRGHDPSPERPGR